MVAGPTCGVTCKMQVQGEGRRRSVPVITLLYSDLGPVGAKRRSAEEVGSGEGRHSPSTVWGSGALPPETCSNLASNLCNFMLFLR